MSTNERTLYLGRRADGAAVWAHLRAEVAELGKEFTMTDHTVREGVNRVAISWTVAQIGKTVDGHLYAHGPGEAPERSMSSARFDRLVEEMGQTPPANRIVASAAIPCESVVFIERMWREYHLNAMQAECDHMREGIDYHMPPEEDLPRSPWGWADRAGWRIHNVVCAAGSGYKYGSAWLAKAVPADDWQHYTDIIVGGVERI